MNKNAIQKFAIWARNELITQVKQRAFQYGIGEAGFGDASADTLNGRLLTAEEKSQRQELIKQIKEKGYKQVMEEVAYTWFNRFIALRFMEVNNYLPSHIRVFSDASGAFKPEILNDVLHLELPGLNHAKVAEYIENSETEALYRYLLLTQCAELKAALPDVFVFGVRREDYTELLFPNNILRQDSVLDHMVSDIPEADWQDAVQIIGWLYQYYISEKHEEVVDPIHGKTIKKEDIPAATQLFTTDWVVRYMVDNSLGRYWIERHPESKLAEKLEFFVTPKNGEIKHIDEFVKPEDVKFLDPCMGSGHILVYAFDVLMEIYKESGYTERDAAAMIVQNNLFGLDIDDRASQLAYFAVMMKARSYDRRFLSRGIKPNVLAIKESNGMGAAVRDGLTTNAEMNAISRYLVDTFRDAKELGSIITAEPKDYDGYMTYLDSCNGQGQLTMEDADWLQNTRPMIKALAHQAKVLAAKYPVVCTNPPYLNKIEGRLKTFVIENYKDYSGDLFSVFTYRNMMFCQPDGYCGYMTPNVWMFIKTYEKLRNYIINGKSIVSLVQMAKGAFFKEATVDICAFILKNKKGSEKGLYFRLENFKGGMEVQKQKVLEALANKDCGYFYEADQTNFSKIPGSPVAYWVNASILTAYEQGNLIGDSADVKIGMGTGKNEIFVREWWEVFYTKIDFSLKTINDLAESNGRYFPYNKGGEFRLWFGNLQEVLWFDTEGRRYMDTMSGHRENGARDFYCKEGLTWSFISSSKFGIRYLPTGCFFDVAGSTLFSRVDNAYTLGFLASCVCFDILGILNPTLNYQAGNIKSLPLLIDREDEVDERVYQNIQISKEDWDSYETSWDFKRNPLI